MHIVPPLHPQTSFLLMYTSKIVNSFHRLSQPLNMLRVASILRFLWAPSSQGTRNSCPNMSIAGVHYVVSCTAEQ